MVLVVVGVAGRLSLPGSESGGGVGRPRARAPPPRGRGGAAGAVVVVAVIGAAGRVNATMGMRGRASPSSWTRAASSWTWHTNGGLRGPPFGGGGWGLAVVVCRSRGRILVQRGHRFLYMTLVNMASIMIVLRGHIVVCFARSTT